MASWVKMSVLNNDALGKRADTIELWIKVAEVSGITVFFFFFNRGHVLNLISRNVVP